MERGGDGIYPTNCLDRACPGAFCFGSPHLVHEGAGHEVEDTARVKEAASVHGFITR